MEFCVINSSELYISFLVLQEVPQELATSPLHDYSDLMEKGLQSLKDEVKAAEGQGHTSNDLGEPTTQREATLEIKNVQKAESKGEMVDKDKPVANGTTRVHLDSTRSESTVKSENSRDADIDIRIENEDGEVIKRKKRRRKKKTKQKHDSANNNQAGPVVEVDGASDDIFEIEDISSDEELSRITSNMTSGAMSKSISLPIVEENKFERTSDWASALEGFSYLNNHPFSDTDLSPLAR